MSMLRNGLAALRAATEDWFGEEVAYIPLGGVRYEIVAVPGRTVFNQRNESGLFVRVETRDFIVKREQLAAEPQRGDEIEFGGRRYEVLAPGGEPAWRWSDPMHTAFRIHTKLTEGES